MNRLNLFAVLAGIGLVIPCGGCGTAVPAQQRTRGNGAATPVRLVKPEKKTLSLVTTQPGRIEAYEQTPVYARVEGYVHKTRRTGPKGKSQEKPIADIGDQVKEGEVLAEIVVPHLEETVKQKDALLAQAKAGEEQAAQAVLVAEKAAESARAKVAEAKAGVRRAEGDYERWKAEHRRITELAAGGSVTQQLVDEKLNQLRAAEAAKEEVAAKVASATAAAGEAQAMIARAKADRAAAAARVKVAEADLDHSKALLAYATIRAPFDGVITERNVDTGHFVRPPQGGAKPLFVIARTDIARVVVEVPEREAALVGIGAESTVHIGALGPKGIRGKVTRTAWGLHPATRTLRTEIDLPNKDLSLRPGLYTTVQVSLRERPNALVVPSTAVVQEKERTYCCLVKSGQVVFQTITPGLRAGDEVEIVSGLNGNDLVVRENAASLKQGQTVEVVNSAGR